MFLGDSLDGNTAFSARPLKRNRYRYNERRRLSAKAKRRGASNKFELHSSFHKRRRPLQRLNRHIPVVRIQHAVDLRAARMHQYREPRFGQTPFFHRIGELPGDD